jgi:hypothetical protein
MNTIKELQSESPYFAFEPARGSRISAHVTSRVTTSLAMAQKPAAAAPAPAPTADASSASVQNPTHAIDFSAWIEASKPFLLPPVCNRLLFGDGRLVYPDTFLKHRRTAEGDGRWWPKHPQRLSP